MMKHILMFTILMLGCSMLFAQQKKITVSLKNQPISLLFQEIQNKSGYNVIYSDEIVSDTMIVTANVNRVAVNQVLEDVLPSKQLYYKMLADGMIVIGSTKLLNGEAKTAVKMILSGLIVDLKGNPIQFGSVALLMNNTLITGNIGTETGDYQLAHQFIDQQGYVLKVSSMGYEPTVINFVYPDTIKLRKIVLKEVQNTLKTVTVTSSKPLIERKTDRYVVNIEGSVLANGNNGLEVLQKTPGIWVGNDGSIKIRGNQSVMVMINDVVQRMSENDLAEYLRTLRSEDISKIEIIASPPSEFEASGSGGIIHIVLKKTRRDGLTGTVASQYKQQENRPAYSGGFTFNYKVQRLYLSGSISAGKDESNSVATNDISYADQSLYSSNTERYNNNGRLMARVGAGYDISDNQSIGFQTVQTINKLNQYFNSNISFVNTAQPLTGTANSEWFRRPVLNGTTVNYSLKIDSLGSGLKIIGDYINSTKTELNNFRSIYTLTSKNSTYRNNTPNTTNLYSLQTDFTKIFKNGISFKSGLKFASTKRDNEVLNEDYVDGTWQLNTVLSNQFIYKEYLSMGYASLEKTFNRLSIKAGLRAEHTTMDGNSITGNEKFNRNYLSLFPSVFLSQKIDEKHNSFGFFSYSRRLQRPSFAYLNPYRLQFDDYLTQLGNPDLMPEYTHKLELGATWKDFSADIYYSITTDKIAQLASPVANNVIEYQPMNFNNSNEYGFSLNAPFKITKWWTMNNSLAGYNLRYTLNDFSILQTTFYARAQNMIVLKKLAELDFALDYRSPFVGANTRYADQFSTDLGINKRVLNKALLLRFYVSDIFNTSREREFTEYSGTTINFYQKRPTRTFSFYVGYTFSSGKKFSNKKIEQSNDEEKSRIGN